MIKIIQRLCDWWKYNPYEEAYQHAMDLQRRNPDTPNLAKLAYYCGCEVDDIVKEIKEQVYDVR